MYLEDHQIVLKELLKNPEILIKVAEVVGVLNKFEGSSNVIPNRAISLNTLAIQESKSSNEIYNR